jgi:hypothetical protein
VNRNNVAFLLVFLNVKARLRGFLHMDLKARLLSLVDLRV